MQTKLFLASMLLIGALCSCTKDEQVSKSPQMMEVTFGWAGMETGSMTKASSGQQILALIESSLPTDGMKLKLKSKTNGNEYQVTMGQASLIPCDTYEVTGTNSPAKTQYLRGSGSYFTHTPYVSVSDEITVKYPKTEYVVNANYESWALCCDASEVVLAEYSCAGNSGEIAWMSDGDLRLVFVHGELVDYPLSVTMYPVEDIGLEKTTLRFYSDENNAVKNDGRFVQYGNWYKTHPNELSAIDSGLFIEFPDWQTGSE